MPVALEVLKLAYLARNPAVPSMVGKVVIVTGSNTGIGFETAKHFVRVGGHVIMACRNESAATKAIQDLEPFCDKGGKAEFLCLDLASLSSVRTFAEKFKAKKLPLHVLVNNAGTNSMFGANQDLTADGLNYVMTVNYTGAFLLTELLTDKLIESAPSRIVNVSSFMHRYVLEKPDLGTCFTTTDTSKSYQISKLFNIHHAKELNRRLVGKGVTANAVHPGGTNSDIWRTIPWYFKCFTDVLFYLIFATNEVGSRSSVYAATSPDMDGVGGKLIYDCVEDPISDFGQDEELAKRVWDATAKVVHEEGR